MSLTTLAEYDWWLLTTAVAPLSRSSTYTCQEPWYCAVFPDNCDCSAASSVCRSAVCVLRSSAFGVCLRSSAVCSAAVSPRVAGLVGSFGSADLAAPSAPLTAGVSVFATAAAEEAAPWRRAPAIAMAQPASATATTQTAAITATVIRRRPSNAALDCSEAHRG